MQSTEESSTEDEYNDFRLDISSPQRKKNKDISRSGGYNICAYAVSFVMRVE